MGEEAMDTEMRVLLERMNGNIELIKSGQSRQADDMLRMEQRHDDNIKRIDAQLVLQAASIQNLTLAQRFSAGERTGVLMSAKALWAALGALGTALVAAVMRSYHI